MPGPHDKREPRGFEPPPWEREQFDKLQSERPGEAPESAMPVEPPTPAAPLEPEAPKDAALPVTPDAPEPLSPDPTAGTEMSDARVDAMIMSLGAEEGPAGKDLYGCGLVAAFVTGFIGVVMLVFAGIAYARTANAGFIAVIGPMAMGLTGGALTGLAVWLTTRTLRRGA